MSLWRDTSQARCGECVRSGHAGGVVLPRSFEIRDERVIGDAENIQELSQEDGTASWRVIASRIRNGLRGPARVSWQR